MKRIWKTGLGLVLCAGIGVAQPPGPTPTSTPKPVATVNGVAISAAELESLLKAAGPVAVHPPEAQRRQRQMEALGMLIDNVLLRHFLDKETRPVAVEEVNRRIEEMQAGLKKQGKSLDEFCQDTNQTMEQLRGNIADHLRWTAYLNGRLTEQAVEAYYKENKDFFDEVTIRVSHIVIRLTASATDADRTKAREALAKVRQQILSDPKADFDELAKVYSHDPQAKKGADLGWIPRKWFDEAFSRAAFALPVGQVSDIVQTDFGMHLIKVTDRKPGKSSDFAKIKEAVREVCSEDMRQEILSRLRKEASQAGKIVIDLP
jgi:parvulin-like peptidyl-prolyl isomerase